MKNPEGAFLAVSLLLLSIQSGAQDNDIITKKDRSQVEGKVIQVTEAVVEIDPTGDIPFLIVRRGDIATIKYANGTLVELGTVDLPKEAASSSPRQVFNIEWEGQSGIGGKLLSGAKMTVRTVSGIALTSSDRLNALKYKARTIETKHSFTDKNRNTHDINLVCERTGGMYSKFKAHLYIDGNLIESKFEKYRSGAQWINASIPGERILLTALEYNFQNHDYIMVGALDRLDGPRFNETELQSIGEIRKNTTVRPMLLVDETFYLNTTLFRMPETQRGVNYFHRDETFFLGRDNALHRLGVETEYSHPELAVRLYLDLKEVKRATADIASKRITTANFDYTTEGGDKLRVIVSQDPVSYGKGYPRIVRVELLE